MGAVKISISSRIVKEFRIKMLIKNNGVIAKTSAKNRMVRKISNGSLPGNQTGLKVRLRRKLPWNQAD
jgi:hypothetical protein